MYDQRSCFTHQSILHSEWTAFRLTCREKPGPRYGHPASRAVVPPAVAGQELAYSTVKTYAAAISSCHVGLVSHPLTKRFLRGVQRLRPVSRALAPQWDLALVLRALREAPFEPLDQVPLKVLVSQSSSALGSDIS